MSDWSMDKKEYGEELDVFPGDQETRLYVEYHEKTDNFCLKLLHYPQHDPGDQSDWNHKETTVEVILSGRNLQVFMEFFQRNSKRSGFWAVDSYTNDKECGPMLCARKAGHPGSHMTAEEWQTAIAPVEEKETI